MTIVLKPWMIAGFLFIFPFVYSFFRKPQGDWDFQVDTILIAFGCWATLVGIAIGKYLFQ